MGTFAHLVNKRRKKEVDEGVASRQGHEYADLGEIKRTGYKHPTSNDSGQEYYQDNHYNYEVTGQKLVKGSDGFRNRVRGVAPRYEPILKRVGRKAGAPIYGDRQPERAKRASYNRGGDTETTAINKKRNKRGGAGTILTGSRGSLGKAATATKTLLGG